MKASNFRAFAAHYTSHNSHSGWRRLFREIPDNIAKFAPSQRDRAYYVRGPALQRAALSIGWRRTRARPRGGFGIYRAATNFKDDE